MSEKTIRILSASRRWVGERDADRYDGTVVTVALDYLKSDPVVAVKLNDEEALRLAQQLIGVVLARQVQS